MKSQTFIWASPHDPTNEQLQELEEQGSVEFLSKTNQTLFDELMGLSLDSDLVALAVKVLKTKENKVLVQPAGSPAFHRVLGLVEGFSLLRPVLSLEELRKLVAISCETTMFAFSERESIDQEQNDGSIRKVAIFRHKGWV